MKDDLRNQTPVELGITSKGAVYFCKDIVKWEEQTYYIVDVAFSSHNPIHRTILFTGFLYNGKPGGYNGFLSTTSGPLEFRDAFFVNVIQKIDMEVPGTEPPTKQRFCTIEGSEIDFDMKVPEEKIVEVATEIWDHPSNHCDYKDGSDASFYSFLKFLWIKFPNGRVEQLVRFIDK
jgi:hypothetical protein